MAVLAIRKKTIRVEYEWKPPRCMDHLGADDEGFLEVKRKKSGGNIKATKHFKSVSIKPKPQYRPKVHQSAKRVSPKMAHSVGKMNVSTSGGAKFYPLVEKISKFEQHIMDGKCVLVNNEGNPPEMVDYSGDHDNEDEVLPVDNEMASFLASKLSGVGYSTNCLLKQWRYTYGNADYDYDLYDDDMYEGQEIPDNIQSICNNLDINVRGRKKK
ncbi:hypothetical protein Tco_1549260 [Tanacetum coccineum]